MGSVSKSPNARHRRKPLSHGSKISDYRFRKVLWHFARDHTATETGKAVRLSTNSVTAIFRKLRVFCFEAGLFLDFYDGEDPIAFEGDNPAYEKALLEYHLARIRAHFGFRSPVTEPPYHFAESCWRHDFHIMMQERPAEAVYGMMERHLLEIIRLCGPVGQKPRNLPAGLELVLRQADERIDWLRRNAPGFRDDEIRERLASVRSIAPSDDEG